MPQSYNISTDFDSDEHRVRLQLNGTLSEDAIPALRQTIERARHSRQQVEIDLSEVTLLDRKAVAFLSKARSDVELINCPAYLRRWIGEEEK